MLNQNKISTYPMGELIDDLMESLADLQYCQIAIHSGVFTYGPSKDSVASRLLGNLKQQKAITTEMARRLDEAVKAFENVDPEDLTKYVEEIMALRPDSKALEHIQGTEKHNHLPVAMGTLN